MSVKRRLSSLAVILLIALSPLPAAAGTLDDAIAFVQDLGDSAIAVLKPEVPSEVLSLILG